VLFKELIVAQVFKKYSTLYARAFITMYTSRSQMNAARTSHHLSFGSIIMPYCITHNWVTVKVVSRVLLRYDLVNQNRPFML